MLDAIARIPTNSAAAGAARIGGSAVERAPPVQLGSADFSEILSQAVVNVAQQLRHAEVASIANMRGMASTQDVVEQMMTAEQTLQAAIAVRDKIVAAYLEISRMQI